MMGLRESCASTSSAPQPSTTDLHAASLAAGEFGRALAELIADLASRETYGLLGALIACDVLPQGGVATDRLLGFGVVDATDRPAAFAEAHPAQLAAEPDPGAPSADDAQVWNPGNLLGLVEVQGVAAPDQPAVSSFGQFAWPLDLIPMLPDVVGDDAAPVVTSGDCILA
ncbi:hypothetical protein [Paracraurococcus ruber]|uniref:Uncharacterized protein n=1 Tax=Paracraurococcus ruber TaxID=77675 RepID=A0ABS1D1E2_9PROT|nr:hypothetical protein [Paracraurococcus ruber]MBK1660321.1 hypothetical protein [Paracraurococcus ruber]TDG27726.1 hypothetical protein E2C05_22060 [Paracraurococcus ruber]